VGRLVLVCDASWVVVGSSGLAVSWDLGFEVLVEWLEVVDAASEAVGACFAFVVAEGRGVSSLPGRVGSSPFGPSVVASSR